MNPCFDILHGCLHVAHCIMPFAATVCFHVLCSSSHNPLVVFIEEVCFLKAFRDKEYAAQPYNNREGAFDYIQPRIVRHEQIPKVNLPSPARIIRHPIHIQDPECNQPPKRTSKRRCNCIHPSASVSVMGEKGTNSLNKYEILVANSSRLNHVASINVILGNRNPSVSPRTSLQATNPPKSCTRPLHKHTRPQLTVAAGMIRLNCRRLANNETGNSART